MTPMFKASCLASFTHEEAQRAGDEWGANCGPGALAAVLNLTLDQVRPHLGDFEAKHYMNPQLMVAALKSLGVDLNKKHDLMLWPENGLVRVQWEGPWTAPVVPRRKRYRHTHWVAARQGHHTMIFDINCIGVGGWVSVQEWKYQVVPWLLKQVEPEANGKWHITHCIEVQPGPETAARARDGLQQAVCK